jgi:hypothetical protein
MVDEGDNAYLAAALSTRHAFESSGAVANGGCH